MTTTRPSLHLLNFGRMRWDLGNMVPGHLDGTWGSIPFPGFLITGSEGRRVLIDSGPDRRHIAEPWFDQPPDAPVRQEMQLELVPEDDPEVQLDACGLSPQDIDVVVVTHTHFDHAGNVALFPNAEPVVHRDVYTESIGRQLPRTDSSAGTPRYRIIDSDFQLTPEVTLLVTPGHCPGHLSVVVTLPGTGTVILSIDAIYSRANVTAGVYSVAQDPDQAKRSGDRLLALARETGGLLIFGHDMEQWRSLRHPPEAYY